MTRIDTVVIGGGPAGLLTAHSLSGDVVVLESRPSVGRPPHCAGIVSVDTLQRLPREALEEYYDGLYLVAGHLRVFLRVRLARINRPLLEDVLVSSLESRGVRVITGCRVESVKRSSRDTRVVARCGAFQASNIVVAEGAAARISRMLGFRPPRVIHAYQVVLGGVRSKPSYNYAPLAVLLGGDVKYAWAIPVEEDKMIVGAAGRPRHVHTLVKHVILLLRRYGASKVVEVRQGVIPYSLPLRKPWRLSRTGWVFVAGDAAALTKATSGGGLYAITRTSEIPRLLEQGREEKAFSAYRQVYMVLVRLYMAARLVYASRRLLSIASRLIGLIARSNDIELYGYDEVGAWRWASRSYVELPEVYLAIARLAASGSV